MRAPIYDEHNEIAAVFAMLSTEPEVDTTLLNLVAQTANSIGKECQIYHLNHDLHDLQTNMDRLINTFNFGVVPAGRAGPHCQGQQHCPVFPSDV